MTHPNDSIPNGLCQCGCGQPTALIKKSQARYGLVRGRYNRFVHGHHNRNSPVDYIQEDQGYESPCWIWQGAIGKKWGYASLNSQRAHIVYWERANGPVPAGMILDHKCRIRHCVNPDHLEPVPQAVNVQRGRLAKLTDDDVREIRRLAETMLHREIAAIYGVSRSTIGHVVRRDTWANIE